MSKLQPTDIFIERFRQAIGNLSLREVGRRCNLTDVTVKRYLDGGSFPSIKQIQEIAEGLDVDSFWLLGGYNPTDIDLKAESAKGNEVRSQIDDSLASYDEKGTTVAHSEKVGVNKNNHLDSRNKGYRRSFFHENSNFDWSDYVPIPIYDIEVSAGSGAFVNGENVIGYKPFLESELRAHGLNPTTLGLATITSDSMTPTLEPKDRILFDWSQTHADGIFIFRVENELFCKRLAREPHRVKVISDNKQYDTFELTDKDNFEVLARVVWDSGYLL